MLQLQNVIYNKALFCDYKLQLRRFFNIKKYVIEIIYPYDCLWNFGGLNWGMTINFNLFYNQL